MFLCPPKSLSGAAENVVNPSYLSWGPARLDNIELNKHLAHSACVVYCGVVSHIPSILGISGTASTSHNHILHLRNELFCTTKGDLSISDYRDKINSIADNLALAGN